MKPGMKDVDEALNRDFDIASDDEATAAGARVRHRLETQAHRISELEVRVDRAQPAESSAFRRKGATRWVQVAAAAVLVIAAAVGTAILWPRADSALYRLVEGDVRVGETIRSNGGGGAVLELSDASRIEMRSHSELSLERANDGVRIRLSSGGIVVNAAKQRAGHLYVQTKDMTVSVVGTVFVVNADEDGSRVAVIEGEVSVRHGATETKLRPGELLDGRTLRSRESNSDRPRAVTSPGPAVFSVASELAWSRRAESLLALLRQQSVAEQWPVAVVAQTPKEPRVAFDVVSIRPSGPAVRVAGARGGGDGGGLNSRPAPSGCVFDSFGYSHQLDPGRMAVFRTTLLHLAAYTLPHPMPGVPERRPELRCGMLTGMGLLTGGPDWIRTDAWDVVAGIPDGTFASKPALTDPVLQLMIRTMLAERFGWVVRREKREVPVYLLKVGKDGPRFNGSIPLTPDRWGGEKVTIVRLGPDGKATPVADLPPPADGGITGLAGQLSARNVSMTNLANHLFGYEGRPVLDRTGLTGRYDFHYTGPGFEESLARIIKMTTLEGYGCCGSGLGQGSPILREWLKEVGLELEEATAPFDAWVIERAERPTEN